MVAREKTYESMTVQFYYRPGSKTLNSVAWANRPEYLGDLLDTDGVNPDNCALYNFQMLRTRAEAKADLVLPKHQQRQALQAAKAAAWDEMTLIQPKDASARSVLPLFVLCFFFFSFLF